MSDLEGWRESEVFAGGEKTHVRLAHALERVAAFRRHMREVTARKHIHRVLPRNLGEFRIRCEWPKPRRNSFPVNQFEHPGFQLRPGARRRNGVGQSNSLV